MTIQFVDVPWGFDKEGFHKDVKEFCRKHDLTQGEAFGMIGLSPSFSQPNSGRAAPTVANLLMVCSFMDLDPRKYFILQLP